MLFPFPAFASEGSPEKLADLSGPIGTITAQPRSDDSSKKINPNAAKCLPECCYDKKTEHPSFVLLQL